MEKNYYTRISVQARLPMLGLLLDCSDNKIKVLDTCCTKIPDTQQVVSSIFECYNGVSKKGSHSELDNEVELFLYRVASANTEGGETVPAWFVNLQNRQRKAVNLRVVHNDDDYYRFEEWIIRHRKAFNYDLTDRDGIKSFANEMELTLQEDIDTAPIFTLYDELVHQYQAKYPFRGSPINKNVLPFTAFYAMECSTVDFVNEEKYESGSLTGHSLNQFDLQLVDDDGTVKSIDKVYNDMTTSSTSKLKQIVTINFIVPNPGIKMNSAIECCRQESLSFLWKAEQSLVTSTCVEELERFARRLFEWIDSDQARHTMASSNENRGDAWTADTSPPIFRTKEWEAYIADPTFEKMKAFAESIARIEGALPPYYLTVDNSVKDAELYSLKRMDPVEINHLTYVPMIARVILETWHGSSWLDNHLVWQRSVEFLLHYYCTTTSITFNKREGPPASNPYRVVANIYKSTDYPLTTILAIMYMFDTALALRCEEELVQCLTMAVIESSARDRHYHFTSFGK